MTERDISETDICAWTDMTERFTIAPTHCVKSIRIRGYSGPNAGKYGPE